MPALKGYKVIYSNIARKELAKIDKAYVHKITQKFQDLVSGAPNIDLKKLHGSPEKYRIRIGIYRAIFEIHDKIVTILVITVGHRKDIYKKMG